MNWVLEHLQLIIGIAAALAYMLNRARGEPADDAEAKPRTAAEADRDERTRRLQEEIRRKIAERRGGAPVTAPAPMESTMERAAPPVLRPSEVRPVDTFGGPGNEKPLGRLMRELQEAAQRELDPAAEERRREEEAAAHRASLERQERLAEEMRALEAARLAEQQKAAAILAKAREERAQAAGRKTGPGAALAESLRDPAELRRAIVLREILSAPVALR